MANLDRITANPNVCLGQPTIRGMRISVGVILWMLAGGNAPPPAEQGYPEPQSELIPHPNFEKDHMLQYHTASLR